MRFSTWTGSTALQATLQVAFYRESETQSKGRENHIHKHWTKHTQSQLKQHKWTISISAVWDSHRSPFTYSDDGKIMKEGRQRASNGKVEKEGQYVWQMDIAVSRQGTCVPPVWQWRLAVVQLEMKLRTANTCRHVPEIHSVSTQDEELETAPTDHFTPLFGQTV